MYLRSLCSFYWTRRSYDNQFVVLFYIICYQKSVTCFCRVYSINTFFISFTPFGMLMNLDWRTPQRSCVTSLTLGFTWELEGFTSSTSTLKSHPPFLLILSVATLSSTCILLLSRHVFLSTPLYVFQR